MYELAGVGILFAGAHVAAVYLGTDVLRLEYAQLLALNVGITVIMSLLLRLITPSWKSKVETVMKQEERQGTAFTDLLLMLLAFIIGGVISAVLLYRRYGPVGWLGIVGASSLVNWLV
jgi:cytochrome b561